MLKNITGIDHVGIELGNIWDAFARFTRLGFTVSTPSRYPDLPVESCQVSFPGIFLSISNTFVDPKNRDTEWITRTKPVGITELMFGTKDINQLKSDLHQNHIDLLEGHAEAEVNRRLYLGKDIIYQKFLIYILSPRATRGVGTIGFCEHATPELVWRPELLSHANTAESIQSLTFLHPKPALLETSYTALFGNSGSSVSADKYERKFSDVNVSFITNEAFAQQIPQFKDWSKLRAPDLKVIKFSVNDIGRTIDYFNFMDIKYFKSENIIYIDPSESCGFMLGFREK